MNSYKQYTAKDDWSLSQVSESYGALTSAYHKISNAYDEYKRTKGSPYMSPLGLSKSEISCLHSLYENAAKMYGLHWIAKIKVHVASSCPMCGNTALGTVEHYLPKTPFPEFSIFSHNLVPSCVDCNSKRGNRHVYGVAEKFIHPIFDGSILSRLELVTRFQIIRRTIKFHLGYNESAFSAAENNRIKLHIKMNVLDKAYRFVTLNYRSELAIRAEEKNTDVALQKLISTELRILKKSGGARCWRGAFLRGLLEINHPERLTVLTSPRISVLRTK
ncbi:hypothetical protein [Pseudomonas sp. SDT291_1_S447]